MKNNKYITSRLYGVFTNNGGFKIYFEGIDEENIAYLCYKNPSKYHTTKKELELCNPLIKSYIDENNYIINWQKGHKIKVENQLYRGIRLDVLLNEFFHINKKEITQEELIEYENRIQYMLNNYIGIKENIWQHRTIRSSLLPEINDAISLESMDKSIIGDFNIIDDIYGPYKRTLKYPLAIDIKKGINNSYIYQDTKTREIIVDRFDEKNNLLNRFYFNPRSGATIQIYYLSDNKIVYYICGIICDRETIDKLFKTGNIASKGKTLSHYGRK